MKRVLLALLALLAAFLGVRTVVRALASDETKIRWLVEDMADGFNATRMNPILAGLDQGFLEETWGADKELVRAGLARIFLERKDPATKRFLYRVAIPESEWKLEVQSSKPPAAKLEFVAELDELHGEEAKSAWKARLYAQLVKTDDGWKFTRVRSDTVAGARIR